MSEKEKELPIRDPECGVCRRPVTIFESHGENSDGEEWLCYMPHPCRYCGETNRLIGMRDLLALLIDERYP